ncbi:hypothetical protein DMENIID0001_041670 [Sergentomyia squamirostris]
MDAECTGDVDVGEGLEDDEDCGTDTQARGRKTSKKKTKCMKEAEAAGCGSTKHFFAEAHLVGVLPENMLESINMDKKWLWTEMWKFWLRDFNVSSSCHQECINFPWQPLCTFLTTFLSTNVYYFGVPLFAPQPEDCSFGN